MLKSEGRFDPEVMGELGRNDVDVKLFDGLSLTELVIIVFEEEGGGLSTVVKELEGVADAGSEVIGELAGGEE